MTTVVGDPAYVRDVLVERGYAATLIHEPKGGLWSVDVTAYDVVWFTNPGYPWDDVRSVDTMKQFLGAGGGGVVRGDDIMCSMGQSFRVDDLTHLVFADNGTTTCDTWTDNNQGGRFEVACGAGHPLAEGIENAAFLYGNDVDESAPANTGEQLLGRVGFAANGCSVSRPVLSVFTPPAP